MIVVQKPVYVSNDGREFVSEKDCEDWEKHLKDLSKNLKFFRVMHCSDLTEGRGFQKVSLIGVYTKEKVSAYHLVMQLMVKTYKNFVIDWYGGIPVELWHIKELTQVEFDNMDLNSFGSRKADKYYITWSNQDKGIVSTTLEELMEF